MLDTLFLRELADEQRIVFFCNDVAIESLDDNLFLLCGVNDAVMTFEDIDVIANTYVTIEIFLALLVQRSPGAKVTPSEVGRTHENLLGLLHDGIVYGNVFALWEKTVDLFLFFGCAIDGE